MTSAPLDIPEPTPGPELAIAIVGIAGRFPGAPDVEAFWRNLRDGVEGIRFFTDEELLARGVPAERLKDPRFVRAGAVLEDVAGFDAAFFGYSPREAALMDPQHRLFLECAWEALERAGHGWDEDSKSVGVFAGTSLSTYLLFNLRTHPELLASDEAFQVMIGNDKDFLATRLAYHLDLKGPALDVQTGCSTSLVATHLACQALLGFQCDVALAGGVSVDVPQRTGHVHQPGGLATPDGRCRPFDAKAAGTLFGNGVGVVVLKRLEDALQDGSPIHAVIRATAINNDGSAKLGFTAPSVDGQAEVIARAQALAEVTPDTVGFVEAHGTGTLLGDPVEVSALTRVFRSGGGAAAWCALGSVKANIGHLDAAAGVAGLIKAALAVEHGVIPPTPHFDTPNPNIDWASSPFFVSPREERWRTSAELPRRAGVSSFGIGGTNAHAILEEAPSRPTSGPSRDAQVLVLSARTEAALETATRRLALHLEANPEQPLADVAWTLQMGRKAFAHRRALVCGSREEAVEVLRTVDRERLDVGVAKDGARPVVFLFPGGGAQHVRMGQELYEKEPAFREAFDACAALVSRQGGPALREALYPAPGRVEDGSPLPRPSVGLPALFSVEYALAKLWESWGVVAESFIGHSMGEYVAACLAGVFSLEDALALVAERGRLFEQLTPGAMLSVALPEEQVLPRLGSTLSLAASNGPSQCVVAGEVTAVEAFAARLTAEGVEHRRVHIDVAAHSHLIDPILPAFSAAVRRLTLNPPTRPVVSGVTGTWLTAEEAIQSDYWVRHLRQPVRFGQGVRTLLEVPSRVLLEVGPGRTLGSLARLQIERSAPTAVLTSMRAPRELGSDLRFALRTLGKLWLAGVQVDFRKVSAGEVRHRVVLPTYPFEHKRHWMEPRAEQAPVSAPLERRADVADWFYLPSWKRSLPPVAAETVLPRSWLLFADDGGVADRLARKLTDAGATVRLVRPGSEFRRLEDGAYELPPGEADGYAALMAALADEGQRPERIVHLWSVDPLRSDNSGQPQPASSADELPRTFPIGSVSPPADGGIPRHPSSENLSDCPTGSENHAREELPPQANGENLSDGRTGLAGLDREEPPFRANGGNLSDCPTGSENRPREELPLQANGGNLSDCPTGLDGLGQGALQLAGGGGNLSDCPTGLAGFDRGALPLAGDGGNLSDCPTGLDGLGQGALPLVGGCENLSDCPTGLERSRPEGGGLNGRGEAVEAAHQRGFLSLLLLARNLDTSRPLQLTVVSSGLHAVTGHESLAPEKATILGACRVLPREIPGLSCASVDVEVPASPAALDALASRLMTEALGSAAGGCVALRGAHRWVQDFAPVRLEAQASRLRPEGTYLLTGGLGAIGLELAEHLARTVRARLVLVGRSALPERSAWESHVAAHDASDPTSCTLRRLLAMEALGARVLVAQADVADPAAMADVLRRTTETFGSLHGVIHAAGIAAGGLAQLRTPEAVAQVLRPKVLGTLVLDALLADTPLDFLMLCSSRTAYTAEPGQVDHCAACSFQESFAQARSARGLPTVALAWDTWREVGQAVATDLPEAARRMRDELLAPALSNAEGLDVFTRVLAAMPTQVVVSTQDLPTLISRGATLMRDALASSDGLASTGPSVPSDDVEATLEAIWRQLLGVEHVAPHENFFDLGGNSLIGLKVLGEVKRRLGVDLPVVSLFANPTLGAMARLLSRPSGETPPTPDRRGRGARRREQAGTRRPPSR